MKAGGESGPAARLGAFEGSYPLRRRCEAKGGAAFIGADRAGKPVRRLLRRHRPSKAAGTGVEIFPRRIVRSSRTETVRIVKGEAEDEIVS